MKGNKKIDIFGTKYTIKYVKEVVDRDDCWIYGHTDSINKVIRISTTLPNGKPVQKEELEFTLLHEVLHALLLSGQYINSSNDEPLVEWLARCIHSLKKQNVL